MVDDPPLEPLIKHLAFAMSFACSPRGNALTNAIITALAKMGFGSLNIRRTCSVLTIICNRENGFLALPFPKPQPGAIALRERKSPTFFSMATGT
jgi:hypothetical protein